MFMTLEEACNVLHVDVGANDDLIMSLVDAIPDYIEVATGASIDAQANLPISRTIAGLLLTQWYYADHADDQALTRTINSLLKALSVQARTYHAE